MTSTDQIQVEIVAITGDAANKVSAFTDRVKGLRNELNPYINAARKAYSVAMDMVEAYADSEKQLAKLTSAFQKQGDYMPEVVDGLTKYAEQLQSVTTFEDDATVAAMALLKSLTHLSGDQIKNLTPLVQDFATAMNMDLQTAAMAVAKTIGSDTNMLSRYGIEVGKSTTESGKLAEVLTVLNDKFGGMSKAVGETTAGQLEIMRNKMKGLEESIGKAFTGKGGLVEALTAGADLIDNMNRGDWGAVWDSLTGKVKEFKDETKGAASALQSIQKEYQQMRELASDPVQVSVAKGIASKAWKEPLAPMNLPGGDRTNPELYGEVVAGRGTMANQKAERWSEKAPWLQMSGQDLGTPVAEYTDEMENYYDIVSRLAPAYVEAADGSENFRKALADASGLIEGSARAAIKSITNVLAEFKINGDAAGQNALSVMVLDLVQTITENLAVMAIGAAVSAAVKGDWVAMWIWLGVAGVAGLASIFSGVQSQVLGANQSDLREQGKNPVTMGGGTTIIVQGNLWMDGKQALTDLMAAAG